MPFFLTSDTFADDPEWSVLAQGRQALLDAVQASHQRLMSKASLIRHDGYFTEELARAVVSNRRVFALLQQPVLGLPPKVHRPGDKCPCLGDSWVAGFPYRMHGFLKRNPSRAETERNQEQRRDLRNTALKALVYARDGGCCRYCRSGVLLPKSGRSKDRRKVLTYDHIDPDRPAGADGANLVVCCGRCNEYKGYRRPDEADMVLLPEPTEAERAAWRAAGQRLFDLPEPAPAQTASDSIRSTTDHRRNSDRSPTEQEQQGHPITDRNSDPPDDPTSTYDVQARPDQVENQSDHRTNTPKKGLAWGGEPHGFDAATDGRTGQPVRGSADPDIYHGRSRPPAPARPQDKG